MLITGKGKQDWARLEEVSLFQIELTPEPPKPLDEVPEIPDYISFPPMFEGDLEDITVSSSLDGDSLLSIELPKVTDLKELAWEMSFESDGDIEFLTFD